MKQKLVKILISLLMIALTLATILYYGIYISPEKVSVQYESIISSKIPASLDNVTVGYFSDVYYLEFMDDKRFEKMLDKMKEAHVDVLLFGGDLFADAHSEKIDGEVIDKLTKQLSSFHAPLGKFYVLGDRDLQSADSKTLVSNILYNAGFEELYNEGIKIHNGKMESINLIGLENMINGNSDIQSAFANTSKENFNILFTHTPDTISNLPVDAFDVAIAGHSLGGQIRIPLFGALKKSEAAEKYSYGLYTYNGNSIRISNGLGTKEADMRLFCPPQFNIFVLKRN